jgi:hypothetical protein
MFILRYVQYVRITASLSSWSTIFRFPDWHLIFWSTTHDSLDSINSYICFTVQDYRFCGLQTTIHKNSQNMPILPIFSQKSCIVPYNSWKWQFVYLQRLSKYYEKCNFNDFWSIFRIRIEIFRIKIPSIHDSDWYYPIKSVLMTLLND